MKKNKKYKLKILNMLICAAIDVAMIYFYIVCINILNTAVGTRADVFNVISNILIVGISILTTSLITVPLIQVRENNALCNKFLAEDVLASSEIFNYLPIDKKQEILSAMECNLYFDNDKVKESMYCSIRDKINGEVSNKQKKAFLKKPYDYYFNLCDYEVECKLVDGYIEKRITKTVEIRSYKKQIVAHYPLITSCFSPEDGIPYCRIESLHINNAELNAQKNVCEEMSSISSPLDVRSGYKKRVEYLYKNHLSFSPDKSVKISICYTTRVNEKDVVSSFRLSYPCRKYKFKFKLLDNLADNYNISMNAFGFCDDGKNTPNSHSKSEVRVSFEDWIFPSNGVAVVLIRK